MGDEGSQFDNKGCWHSPTISILFSIVGWQLSVIVAALQTDIAAYCTLTIHTIKSLQVWTRERGQTADCQFFFFYNKISLVII